MNHQIIRINESPAYRLRISGFFLLIAGIVLAFHTCKNPEGLFEEYIVPSGMYYPGKVLNPETYTGKNRIKVEWQNGADPKVVKARIFWNNYTDSVEVPIIAGTDVTAKIVEQLAENDYSFKIRTYDAENHASIPVEVNGVVYGERYEGNLMNRFVKSSIYYGLNTLQVIWSEADTTEVGLQLEYTNIEDAVTTLSVDQSETVTTIRDFKDGNPIFVTTMHKPSSAAIDVFHAPKTSIPYGEKEPEWVEITEDAGLKNTQFPFARGTLISGNRFYLAEDWNTNAAGAVNGNVDGGANGQRLTLWTYAAVSVAPSFENGKLYQTVELEAGTYRFEAMYWGIQPINESCLVYVVAALGDNLPDIEDIEPTSSAVIVPNVRGVNGDVPYSVDIDVLEKGFVSVGFVGNVSGNSQFYFSSVKLYGLYVIGLSE